MNLDTLLMTAGPAGRSASMKATERPLHNYVAKASERPEIRRGVPLPLGTHESAGGVNFEFFSRHASRVRLELFDLPADAIAIPLEGAHILWQR